MDFVHTNHAILYTDGSKLQEQTCFAAVFAGECVRRRLRAESNVFTAELTAIRDALIIASNTQDQTNTIFSDSKIAIEAIQKYNNNHPVVKEITWLIRLQSVDKSVTLCNRWTASVTLGSSLPSLAFLAMRKRTPKQERLLYLTSQSIMHLYSTKTIILSSRKLSVQNGKVNGHW